MIPSTTGRPPLPRADEPEPASRSPAYIPLDGAFVLYNDLVAGRPQLDLNGPRPANWDVAEVWHRASGPQHPFPAGPVDTVEGYGVFTFPYGPISMGVPESGRFDVRTYGERVLALTPVAGFKSRRILASLAGLPVADAALRVERLAGPFAAAHASAFLAAAESAQGASVPLGELWVRALAQELQRIYNHLHVLGRVAEAASQNVGQAQTHALAEELLRVQGRVFGHRWLFGALLPGGPPRHLGRGDRATLSGRLKELLGMFERLWSLFLDSRTFLDRILSTAVVPRERAEHWGAVGPTLRACGVAWDDRLRAATPPYTDLFLELPHESGGDALARVLVRVEEVRTSFLLIEQLLDRWPTDPGWAVEPPAAVRPHRGLGRVESPSGDLVYDVTVTGGRIASVGMRSASQANFPLFARSMAGGVFTDFHFAWESFGIAFAEVDA